MRILFVSNGYPPRGQWGTEFYTRELARGLHARGHELAVLHPERSGGAARYTLERERAPEAELFLLHNRGDPRKSFEDSYANTRVEAVFREVLREWRPDLVHFTYLLWGLSVRLPEVARGLGVPSVLTLTDYGLLCHRGQMYDWSLQRCFGPHPPARCAHCVRTPSRYDLQRPGLYAQRALIELLALLGGLSRVVTARDLARREQVVRAALEQVDTLIAPTEVLAQAFLRFGVPARKMERLVYALDETALAGARAEPAGSTVVFGFLGQFTPHKGLSTLLRAVELLRHRLPESVEPWELRLYGAPSGGRHRLYARELLSTPDDVRVQVHEPFDASRAGEVFAQLHALVLPSEWDENAPLSVLQARAAGIPVIASSVPGMREVIEQGVHGLLFPLGDAHGLANAMREVILRRVRRHSHPALPMSLAQHLQHIERIYRDALRGARAAPTVVS